MSSHRYAATLRWTGNRGPGTTGYRDYDRSYDIACPGKPRLRGSADPAYLGDPACHNPEDMLLCALSACHMLWYLHLCAVNAVVVTAYEDAAEGEMTVDTDGGGRFTRVVLHPRVTITTNSDPEVARTLHREASAKCFIANSINFPVEHEPEIVAA
jgi:organic hydroperoxide reductase OsmC/OhrA